MESGRKEVEFRELQFDGMDDESIAVEFRELRGMGMDGESIAVEIYESERVHFMLGTCMQSFAGSTVTGKHNFPL